MRRTLVRIALGVLVVATCLLAVTCHDADVTRRALWQHTTDSLTLALHAERQRADSLGRTFRAETVQVRRTVTRWQTTLDTLWRHDTIPRTVRESVLVATAATAISTCTQTVDTCGALVAAKDSQMQTVTALWHQEQRKARASWRTGLRWVTVGAVIGAVVRR